MLTRKRKQTEADRHTAHKTAALELPKKATLLSPPDMATTLKKMAKADQEVSKIQLDLVERRLRLKNNVKRCGALAAELAGVTVAGDGLNAAVSVLETLLKRKHAHLRSLRFWGSATVLTDLPDEVLRFVLLYLRYDVQQRCMRVCRHWKYIIDHELDHVYLNISNHQPHSTNYSRLIGALEAGHANPSRRRYGGAACTVPSVRQLTCGGDFGERSENFSSLVRQVEILTDRFPGLLSVNFIHTIVQPGAHHLTAFLEKHPSVRVSVRESAVSTLQDSNFFWDHAAFQFIVDKYALCRVPLPDMVITNVKDFQLAVDRLIWPYPDKQTEWLTSSAPRLNLKRPFLKVIAKSLRNADDAGDSFINAKNQPCEKHNKFCNHLDVNFYKDKFDGQARLLLSLCILHQKIPHMKQPPVPFFFLDVKLIGRRRQSIPIN